MGRFQGELAFTTHSTDHSHVRPPPKRIPPRGPGKSSARARILAQWRGVDVTPLEKARQTPAKNVGDLLPKLMRDLKLDARRDEAEIVKVWNATIDPEIHQTCPAGQPA